MQLHTIRQDFSPDDIRQFGGLVNVLVAKTTRTVKTDELHAANRLILLGESEKLQDIHTFIHTVCNRPWGVDIDTHILHKRQNLGAPDRAVWRRRFQILQSDVFTVAEQDMMMKVGVENWGQATGFFRLWKNVAFRFWVSFQSPQNLSIKVRKHMSGWREKGRDDKPFVLVCTAQCHHPERGEWEFVLSRPIYCSRQAQWDKIKQLLLFLYSLYKLCHFVHLS